MFPGILQVVLRFEEYTMNFGEKIALLRNLKGLSKRQVGDAIGTSDV